jgi:hypothetical protein
MSREGNELTDKMLRDYDGDCMELSIVSSESVIVNYAGESFPIPWKSGMTVRSAFAKAVNLNKMQWQERLEEIEEIERQSFSEGMPSLHASMVREKNMIIDKIMMSDPVNKHLRDRKGMRGECLAEIKESGLVEKKPTDKIFLPLNSVLQDSEIWCRL